MRVLVISHNVFSASTNMGKTLSSYFESFKAEDLAQFYIQSEIPTLHICKRYYRVTDKEMLRSIIGFKTGTIYGEADIQQNATNIRTDSNITAKLHQKARKRTPLIYIARNLWWKLGHWNSRKFKSWLDEFDPECIFFTSGDYAFMYDITRKIAKKRGIPLYICCMDDYYFHNRNSESFLGRLHHRFFMRSVRKTVDYASALFCICDRMTKDYAALFNKKCVTLHTAASFSQPLPGERKRVISYIGNLGFQRHLQLVEIGQALKHSGTDIDHIDVYSAEKREEILKDMTEENGIVFHGKISAEEVKQVIAESLAVIHTESFEPHIKKQVRYSVSTKIADSLMSGTCILAYGPNDIASIQYLLENHAAYCITDSAALSSGLSELIENDALRKEITENALALAKRNHLPVSAETVLQNILLK